MRERRVKTTSRLPGEGDAKGEQKEEQRCTTYPEPSEPAVTGWITVFTRSYRRLFPLFRCLLGVFFWQRERCPNYQSGRGGVGRGQRKR